MQEHFKGRIMKRMLGETKFKEFVAEYDKYKAYNVYKQVFEDQFKVSNILKDLKTKWDF